MGQAALQIRDYRYRDDSWRCLSSVHPIAGATSSSLPEGGLGVHLHSSFTYPPFAPQNFSFFCDFMPLSCVFCWKCPLPPAFSLWSETFSFPLWLMSIADSSGSPTHSPRQSQLVFHALNERCTPILPDKPGLGAEDEWDTAAAPTYWEDVPFFCVPVVLNALFYYSIYNVAYLFSYLIIHLFLHWALIKPLPALCPVFWETPGTQWAIVGFAEG